eukprot:8075973-Alexandrium_andersonii.AAC.1
MKSAGFAADEAAVAPGSMWCFGVVGPERLARSSAEEAQQQSAGTETAVEQFDDNNAYAYAQCVCVVSWANPPALLSVYPM